MKKIIATIMLMVLMATMCACNYNLLDTKFDFNKAYIKWTDGSTEEVEIKSWTEGESDYTITTADGRIICTSQINIVLVKE